MNQAFTHMGIASATRRMSRERPRHIAVIVFRVYSGKLGKRPTGDLLGDGGERW
jgi:hypothetical protein